MDFKFTPEQEQFRQEVLEFLSEELPPGWEDRFDLETAQGADEYLEFGRLFSKKLAQRRWLAMHWPAEYGGLDASVTQQMIYNEETAYYGTPITLNMGAAWVGPALMMYGSAEQKRRFVPAIASSDEDWCTLYSEPGAGSDLAAVQTRAVRAGDEWVINGHKIWTSGAHLSDWGWLAARTDPSAPKHKGISMFLVPMKAPGITMRPLVDLAGHHGFNEVFLDNVRIPANYLVGQENGGWYVLAAALDFERSSIAGVAASRRWWEELVRFVREGRSSAEMRPEVQHRLAEMGVEIEVGQCLSYRVVSMQEAGKIPNYEASLAKLYASELAQRLARTGMDLLGLHGQLLGRSKRGPLNGRFARYYLTSASATIAGGTSEIQRNVIAVRGLGLPRA
jgi:alkylation response protein AidB-like acyl-CoA dehydrogenase